MSNDVTGWGLIDHALEWLVDQLGEDFASEVAATGAALSDPMGDGERHTVLGRQREIAIGVAAIRCRDRHEPVPMLPSVERRAVMLAIHAWSSVELGVGGVHERLRKLHNADDTTYRSTQFELECAHLLARDSALSVEFLPDGAPGRTGDLVVGGLIHVECKQLQGRSQRDRRAADLWQLLERNLSSLTEVGHEYLFEVETDDGPTDSDVRVMFEAARDHLSHTGVVNVAHDLGRMRYHLRKEPLEAAALDIQSRLAPSDPLESYHTGRVDVRAQVMDGRVLDGVSCTYAFRTVEKRDLDAATTNALSTARRQLPEDRASLVFVDAYEPINDYPPGEREHQRRVVYTAVVSWLDNHGRPTGAFLAAPSTGDSIDLRSFLYAGNKSPSASFPTAFTMWDWSPASSETLDRSE